jgi:hypothetical protein
MINHALDDMSTAGTKVSCGDTAAVPLQLRCCQEVTHGWSASLTNSFCVQLLEEYNATVVLPREDLASRVRRAVLGLTF